LLATDIVATGNYKWCNLEADLRARLQWVDDGVGYMEAYYGRRTWDRLEDNTLALLVAQRLAFMIVSIIGNSRVIWYHWTVPAHPKFSIALGSRIAIAVHVLFGTLGVFVPLLAFFAALKPSEGHICMVVALVAELMHAGTAVKMMPNVFGTKVIMLPAYLTCVVTKFGLAVGLLIAMTSEPVGGYKEQLEWMWAWWCAHNTYAWVRLWMVFFTSVKAVRSDQYTVAVMLAGAVCCGQAVGFLFLCFFFVLVALHQIFLGCHAARLGKEFTGNANDPRQTDILRMHAKRHALFWQETSREWVTTERGTLDRAIASMKRRKMLKRYFTPSSMDQAGVIFDAVDDDQSGIIDAKELSVLMMRFGVQMKELSIVLKNLHKKLVKPEKSSPKRREADQAKAEKQHATDATGFTDEGEREASLTFPPTIARTRSSRSEQVVYHELHSDSIAIDLETFHDHCRVRSNVQHSMNILLPRVIFLLQRILPARVSDIYTMISYCAVAILDVLVRTSRGGSEGGDGWDEVCVRGDGAVHGLPIRGAAN
jgi:hypothetical protein